MIRSSSITRWHFFNPVHVQFGRGSRRLLIDEITGKHCLMVCTLRGHRQFYEDPILKGLSDNNKITWVNSISANPSINGLQLEIDRLKGKSQDVIVAFGGGSVIDSAKVFSIGLSDGQEGIMLSEMIMNQSLISQTKPIPLYVLPTTSGTGSEVTPFATIWDHEKYKKHSLSGQNVFPYMALVDPELTDQLPTEIALSTGLDAINQAAESIWNRNAISISKDLAVHSLSLGFDALPRIIKQGGMQGDRDAMAECSLFAGMAISQTRTALCHSISYPITAHYGVPHGLACAFTMPYVLRLNLQADDGRFDQVAAQLLARGVGTGDLLLLFDELHEMLSVRQRVRSAIGSLERLLSLIPQMYTPERANNNMAPFDNADIEQILRSSWYD